MTWTVGSSASWITPGVVSGMLSGVDTIGVPLVLDMTGFAITDVQSSTVQVSSDEAGAGSSPRTITVTVWVVDTVYRTFLPLATDSYIDW